nr:MAG TPA: hypothetical protein [Caudoviricetes sp.]
MTVEELKAKKSEMEQKISVSIKEFEECTAVEIKAINLSRCTLSNEFGIEKDFKYNIKSELDL